LIFDTKGADCAEKGIESEIIVKRTSLLALAIADVVLINIQYESISHEIGSGFELLKVIFEVILELYGLPTKKKLLFVVRDFNFEEYDIEIT